MIIYSKRLRPIAERILFKSHYWYPRHSEPRSCTMYKGISRGELDSCSSYCLDFIWGPIWLLGINILLQRGHSFLSVINQEMMQSPWNVEWQQTSFFDQTITSPSWNVSWHIGQIISSSKICFELWKRSSNWMFSSVVWSALDGFEQ